jgi:hypothetical protein
MNRMYEAKDLLAPTIPSILFILSNLSGSSPMCDHSRMPFQQPIRRPHFDAGQFGPCCYHDTVRCVLHQPSNGTTRH